MSTFHASDHRTAPYNTAYLHHGRRYLYDGFGIDRTYDDGCPETERQKAPPDRIERREALCSFYGGRCGRCLHPVAPTSTADAALAYCYSLADGAIDRWALENLIPLCEGCYEVVSIDDPDTLDTFNSAYQDAQQFPQWLGDPRVAVERVPLTGREHWLREQLVDRLELPDEHGSVNEPVYEDAVLARSTAASVAVALGEELAADAWRPVPETRRLTDRWDCLDAAAKAMHEEAVTNQLQQFDELIASLER